MLGIAHAGAGVPLRLQRDALERRAAGHRPLQQPLGERTGHELAGEVALAPPDARQIMERDSEHQFVPHPAKDRDALFVTGRCLRVVSCPIASLSAGVNWVAVFVTSDRLSRPR